MYAFQNGRVFWLLASCFLSFVIKGGATGSCCFPCPVGLVHEEAKSIPLPHLTCTYVQLDRAAVKGFNLVSPFLPPETREKITMLGSGDFLPELLEWCEVRGRALIHSCQAVLSVEGRQSFYGHF